MDFELYDEDERFDAFITAMRALVQSVNYIDEIDEIAVRIKLKKPKPQKAKAMS